MDREFWKNFDRWFNDASNEEILTARKITISEMRAAPDAEFRRKFERALQDIDAELMARSDLVRLVNNREMTRG